MTTYTVTCTDDGYNEFRTELATGTTIIDSDGDVMTLQDDGRFHKLDGDRSWGVDAIIVRYILTEKPKPVKAPPRSLNAPKDWMWALVTNDRYANTDRGWLCMLLIRKDDKFQDNSKRFEFIDRWADPTPRPQDSTNRILALYPEIPVTQEAADRL